MTTRRLWRGEQSAEDDWIQLTENVRMTDLWKLVSMPLYTLMYMYSKLQRYCKLEHF